jgi:hypothetical protein
MKILRNIPSVPTEFKGLFLLSVAVVLLAVETLLVFMGIMEHVPLKSSLAGNVFQEWAHLLRPEREMLFLRFFVVTAIVMQAAGVWIFRRKLKDEALIRKLIPLVIFDAILVFFLLSAAFKSIIYDYRAVMAHRAFDVLLVIAVASKIFWPWLCDLGRTFYGFFTREENLPALKKLGDVVFPALIFALIFIPYPSAVVMRSFVGEQFHHNDSYIMGPGWAFLKGNLLNMDVISQYGLGMPVFLSMAAKIFFGGFSYENIFLVLMWACIVYYLLAYFLLRKWVGNPWLVMAALMLGIKWQMFHTGVFPIVFTYGSATVTRFYFDIFFLILIFFHLRHYHKALLMAAGATAGVAMFYISSDGLYLVATFYCYLLIHLAVPRFREKLFAQKPDWFFLPLYAVVAPLVTFACMWWLEGPRLFSPEFWYNMGEFIQYFLSGFGVTPMSESLKYRYFLASFTGFLMPLGYVFTMIAAGSLIYFRKWKDENLFIIVLCVYGLGIYHYYVARSAVTSYDTVCLPFVYILCFWVKTWADHLPRARANALITGVFLLSFYALFTNHNFMCYPNAFSFSRNPMTDPVVAQRLSTGLPYFNHLFVETPEQLKLPANSLGEKDEKLYFEKDFNSDDMMVSYYSREADFKEDAALIAQLTPKDAKVPVISSFEIKMLMQADRAPFFYYFPLVISRPMHMRMFPVTSMYTVKHFKKTIGQLEGARPEYIFLERIFLERNVPQAYYENDPALMALLDYVFKNYAPAAQGKYLVAMKRKGIED